MATFIFACNACQVVDDNVVMASNEYVGEFPCGATLGCNGTMRRVWHKVVPTITMVKGAGGSPSR